MGGRAEGFTGTRPRRGARLGGVVLVGLLLTGTGTACGGSEDPAPARSTPTASAADRACRTTWSMLGVRVRGEAAKGTSVREAFAERWNVSEAGIDYYRQTATATQCGDLLDDRRTAVRQTAAVVADALPYDAGQRLVTASTLRAMYRGLPGGTKEPKPVVAAYATLTKQTPVAVKDLAPAYAELAAADPTDAAAVKQGLGDLRLLSETSDAWVAVTGALRTIDGWNASLQSKPTPQG